MRNSTLTASLACSATVIALGGISPAIAETGPSSSQDAYLVGSVPGAGTTSILTVGDEAANGYRMVGLPDGLGAYDNGNGTFTVLMNHELGSDKGVQRDHGSIGAFVSKWVIEKDTLKVQSGEDLVQRVFEPASGGGWNQVRTAFNRLCSANLASLSALYDAKSGRGTTHRIFMDGEESSPDGRALAYVITGPDAGSSYVLPALGRAAWENQVAMPGTGRKTVVVGTDDGTGGQVYLYVGSKQKAGNDVERAGLTNGKLYGVKIAGVDTEDDTTSVPAKGASFSLVEIPGAASMTGAELEQASQDLDISSMYRPEDSSFDPSDRRGLYLATTASFIETSRLWHLRFWNADKVVNGGRAQIAVASPAYDATDPAGPRMMDNLTVNRRGQVLVQEDPGNQAYRAGVFRYDPAGGLVRVAQHDEALFTPGGGAFVTQDEESSGIIPAPFLGAGAYLLADQIHAPSGDPETVELGQLALLRLGGAAG